MRILKSVSLMVVMFLAVLFLAAGFAVAAPTPVKATNTWMGSVEDAELGKAMPESGVITNAKDFEKLIKAWGVAEKVPDLDFDAEIILVTKTSGSRLTLNASLDENGDLKTSGIATRDFRPGFRYVIISVPKKGVVMVNGKELPKVAK